MTRLISSSAFENSVPIRDALAPWIAEMRSILEISSGTGQHIVDFARQFPQISWQPSDVSAELIESIKAWTLESGLNNIKPPLRLDALERDWNVGQFDSIFCCNMIHIAPWEACQGLFRNAAQVIRPGGFLFLYGPFFEDNRESAQSNIRFDESLRSRDSAWGVRKLSDVCLVAMKNGFSLDKRIEMPANNLTLVFKKIGKS